MENPIRDMRLTRAWSQDHLAEISGLSKRTIQRLEAGGRLSMESKQALASCFECKVSELEMIAPHKKPAKTNFPIYHFILPGLSVLFGVLFGVGFLQQLGMLSTWQVLVHPPLLITMVTMVPILLLVNKYLNDLGIENIYISAAMIAFVIQGLNSFRTTPNLEQLFTQLTVMALSAVLYGVLISCLCRFWTRDQAP